MFQCLKFCWVDLLNNGLVWVRVLFKFPSPAKKTWGSETNDDIFGFRPMEVLGTKTPAFFFEMKFVYISCTNVENYLPSNNFGYRTIFIFFGKRDHKLRHQKSPKYIYDVSFWMFAKWAPYDGYQRAEKTPKKIAWKKRGNRGDISPRQVEFWMPYLKTGFFGPTLYCRGVCFHRFFCGSGSLHSAHRKSFARHQRAAQRSKASTALAQLGRLDLQGLIEGWGLFCWTFVFSSFGFVKCTKTHKKEHGAPRKSH